MKKKIAIKISAVIGLIILVFIILPILAEHTIHEDHRLVGKTKRHLLVLKEELFKYKEVCNQFPKTLEELLPRQNSVCSQFTSSKIDKLLFVDGWGKPLEYNSDGEHFRIFSTNRIPHEISDTLQVPSYMPKQK